MSHSQPNSADLSAGTIAVRGATEHNLKDIDVEIPRRTLAVVTGVSGSGKSSLAFDTICAEGRRRYLETFSSYARQFLGRLGRPAVRHIDGLSPAVAVDQSTGVRSPRSTVGTMTEVYDLLRLLWARAGTVDPGTRVRLERALFSFNSPRGACPACKGLGVDDRLDPDLLIADPARSVRDGALRITTPTGYVIYSQVTLDVLDQVCRAHGFSVDIPWQDLTPDQRDVVLNGSDRVRIPYGKHPLESRLRWSGITARPREEGVYKGILPVMEQILRVKRNRNILRFVRSMPCRACAGTRLRPEALAVRFHDLTIAEAAALPVSRLPAIFNNETDPRECAGGHEGAGEAVAVIARAVVDRCEMLERLGLGYLTLDRESTTLSGGEAQRLRLARQAGIGLTGVLYVLDEPSVGLHPRDTERVLEVLVHLRDAGNTVLVVEHDEQTIRHADWIVDVGPAAGHEGGEILYSGPADRFWSPDAAAAAPRLTESRTRAFLTGRDRIAVPTRRRSGSGSLRVSGITKHNLHDVAVEFRLGALNAVTGVSGAGKSTLVEETVRRVQDDRGDLDKVIAIDQAPIGRTPRSNPATYTGLFDAVRARFAAEPDAVAAGFGKGRFSFNVAGGRCEACEGAGVQQVGMQFLGTVAVVCETCGGRRFNDETLRVRYRGKSIRDVLDLPIAEAVTFFADEPAIARVITALHALGLGYLTLGHPATMLSGGEAQRVKLATELARPGTGRTLYVLDEPTTGLHPADIARLLSALDGLVEKGNTVIVIEHDLDVVKTADWIVDLGPGGGDEGGRVVASGPPETIAAEEASATGQALRGALGLPARHLFGVPGVTARRAPRPTDLPAPIRFSNVTTHNLQHLDVAIPARQLTVVTGLSGSGKSSLAFDTIFAEGQQRFAESFSTYGRRFVTRASDAEFDDASGLTPAVAISQRAPSRNPRSTLATLTEIHDHYRLLFARLGTRRCPQCGAALDGAHCAGCGFAGVARLTASMFSPNSEHGACARCDGLGHVLECDPARLITDPSRPLSGGAMAGHKTGRFYGDPHGQHMAILRAVGQATGIDYSVAWQALDDRARHLALRGAGDRVFDVEWQYTRGARSGLHHFQAAWPGLLEYVRQEYDRKHADHRGAALEPLMIAVPCGACGGGKLQPEFLAVRFAGLTIQDLLGKSVGDSLAFFAALDAAPAGGPAAGGPGAPLEARTLAVSADLRADVTHRLERLRDAGLGYLTLDRPATTLSGGEAQRVRLATQLGSGLTGITYVLDEPTVGLHPRDTARLVALLGQLRDAGNTVIVVEHDREVIAAADHVIEIGPGAGTAGGRIVAQGPPAHMAELTTSRTSRLLAPRPAGGLPAPRPPLPGGVAVRGACAHNLHQVDVEIPRGGLVVVTGVSGSGKSSLVFDVLAPSVRAHAPVNCRECVVRAPFADVIRVEPTMSGGSPWSNPATQVGLFDLLRDRFARTDTAAARGLQKRDFSPAQRGGRCEACEGLGQIRVPMDFLPDVWVACEECHATGFGPDVLACTIDGRSIADVLAMTGEGYGEKVRRSEGPEVRGSNEGPKVRGSEGPAFAQGASAGKPIGSNADQDILRRLGALAEVGLGYVRLGQPARTLSGGERQRLLLASALVDRAAGPTLYLFDEPTTGLHADDVAQLLRVFDHLIDAGHSLVVVEHNLDVVAAADWVIDLGPDGGNAGGRLVAAGPPGAIAATPGSYTGQALMAERNHHG